MQVIDLWRCRIWCRKKFYTKWSYNLGGPQMNVYGISFVSGLKGPIDTNAWRIRDLVRASGWVVQGCIRSGTYFGIRFQKTIISSFPISSVRVSHWHNVFFFLVFSGHNQKTLNKNEKAIPNQNSFSVVFMLFTETFVTESRLVSLPHLGSKFRRFSIFFLIIYRNLINYTEMSARNICKKWNTLFLCVGFTVGIYTYSGELFPASVLLLSASYTSEGQS